MTFFIDDHPEHLDLDAALYTLNGQWRSRVERYQRPHDRRLSLSAYLLLQRILRQEYGIDEPCLRFTDRGKPLLDGHEGIHFSLSHCREAAACIVDTVPVGIDVESLSSYDDDLVDYTMNDDEKRDILSQQNRRLAFIRRWTMKESLLKMTGEGIRNDMRNVLEDSCIETVAFHTVVFPRYVCTVCRQTPPPP